MEVKYDVFLSHNHKDKFWVRRFYEFLVEHNISVFFDDESIDYGVNILNAIGDGIEYSKHVVLILTADSISSQWVGLETSLARYSDPNSQRRKIIPILLDSLEKEEIPFHLRPFRIADFTSRINREIGIRKLLSQIGIENSREIKVPNSLLDSNYENKVQEYRETLQRYLEKVYSDPEFVTEAMMECNRRLMLDPIDIGKIEIEILGATLQTIISNVADLRTKIPCQSANEEIPEEVIRAMNDLLKRLEKAKGKTFTILLVGKTGVGKSSTVNSLMGDEVAPVDHFDACTKDVFHYKTDLNGAIVHVIDTPGLCDLEIDDNDQAYIDLIRHKVQSSIDIVLYVAWLDGTRVDSSEQRGLRILTEAFGNLFWKKAVIAFTRSDKVDNSQFDIFLKERTKRIHRALSELKISDDIVYSIPSVAVDNTNLQKTNPNGEKWIKQFYLTVFNRIENQDTKDVLLLSTVDKLEERGISPLNIARRSAIAGGAALTAVYPAAAIASMLGIGSTSVGAVMGANGAVLTGLFAFSNPAGWALIIAAAGASGYLAYKNTK